MELIANTLQTVEAGANIQFVDEVVSGCNSILHRAGSGLVTVFVCGSYAGIFKCF